MSGHSKWSKVKHQKAGTDAAKSSAFTKASHALSMAVKEGGNITDPDKNFRLRLAVDKARSINMPKDTIDRAIERAVGEGGASLESVLYEAIGPAGSALVIEAATDNRQRTVAEIKNVLDRHGGHLASPGAVVYQFIHVGYINIPAAAGLTLDTLTEIAVSCGADDVSFDDGAYELYCKPDMLSLVKQYMQSHGIVMNESSLLYKPVNPIVLDDVNTSRIMTLVEHIDSLSDVQNIYTNIA